MTNRTRRRPPAQRNGFSGEGREGVAKEVHS